jgi:RNA polymerase sigma factor (TIGR02999 family)
MTEPHTITMLLSNLARGERQAFDWLIPLVFAELRRIAGAQLRSERVDHTLQPTALVHEAYARMVGSEPVSFNGRAHFLAVAAQTMRRILIDHARMRGAAKRDHGREHVALDTAGDISLQRPALIIALDDALNTLQQRDPLMARLIELRFFGGLTAEESSGVVNREVGEVRRSLRLGQAWLRRELEGHSCAQGQSNSSA